MVINFNTAVNQAALTGGFLNQRGDNSSQAQILLDQGRKSQTITGQSLNENDSGAISNLINFQDFLSGGVNNPQSIFTNTHNNLENLGNASIDISKALDDNIAIREDQRFADNSALAEINKRLSGQVISLGESISNLSSGSASAENTETGSGGGWFDFLGLPSLPTFDSLKTPLLVAGLGLAALIVVPRLIKSGFKN
jgi:hypothetical protein